MSSIQRRNTIPSSSYFFKSHGNNDHNNNSNGNDSDKVTIKRKCWSCPAFEGETKRRPWSLDLDTSSPSSYTSMKDLISLTSTMKTPAGGDSIHFWNTMEPFDDPDELPIKNHLIRRAAWVYLDQGWIIWRETHTKRGFWAELDKCFGFVKTVLGAVLGRKAHP